MENSLWQRLWTCRKTDCGMSESLCSLQKKWKHHVQPMRRYLSTRIYGVITKRTIAKTWSIIKATGAQGWQPYNLNISIVLKSGNLNLLEYWGPVQACNGIAVTLADKSYTVWRHAINVVEAHAQKKAKHRTFDFFFSDAVTDADDTRRTYWWMYFKKERERERGG